MSKNCKFVSDNTPFESPNTLTISQRDDGDIELHISVRNETDRSVSIRASGSRLRNWGQVIKKFSEIIDLLNEERRC